MSLHDELQSKIFRFEFPDSIIKGQVNTYYDAQQEKFIVPEEADVKKSESDDDDEDTSRNFLGMLSSPRASLEKSMAAFNVNSIQVVPEYHSKMSVSQQFSG